ncbi:hypothetical protein SAMN04489761_2429 [Tenacibaculum sp. MAR_2009_124]|uniref:hypothetical protein n=1 Tax=Tenacibaculum sp. MAR_2009_124 TaxID=1250059 RepID=UPI0008995D68|nr:hypothetical protein [Tenacibaculum sp. MAR_2009_124]SEC22823.1 hypothetical protein SAMN04489761_2429 [Tenacibaculum sp. MAR_2009_124]
MKNQISNLGKVLSKKDLINICGAANGSRCQSLNSNRCENTSGCVWDCYQCIEDRPHFPSC